jgi:hypothetical protein
MPTNQVMIEEEWPFIDTTQLYIDMRGTMPTSATMFKAGNDVIRFSRLRTIPPIQNWPDTLGEMEVQMNSGGAETQAVAAIASVAEDAAGVQSVVAAPTVTANDPVTMVERMEPYGAECEQYSIEDMARRPNVIEQFAWSSSDPLGQIERWAVPYDLIGGTAVVPFNHFVYWGGPVHVRLELTSSFSQIGKLRLVFIPDMDEGYITARIGLPTKGGFQSQILNQFVEIDAGANRSVEMTIPFVYPMMRLDTLNIGDGYEDTTTHSLGTLILVVQNPLVVATGSPQTTAQITMYADFPQATGCPAFNILRQVPLTKYTALSRATQRRLGKKDEEKKDEEAMADFKPGHLARLLDRTFRPQGGAMSSMAKEASNITKVVKGAVDVADHIAGSLAGNNDKPGVMLDNDQMCPVNTFETSTTMNTFRGMQLGARPGEVRALTEMDVGTSTDEMSLGYLMGLWNLENFTTTLHPTTTGMVFEMPFMPTPAQWQAELGDVLDVGPTEYFSHLFDYWNAGYFELRMQAVRNRVTGCKLWVTAIYNADALGPITLQEATSGYGVAIDLADGQSDYYIRIPFRSNLQWYPIPHFKPGLELTMKEVCPALIQVYVLNPLVQDATVPPYIYLNFYWRIGDLRFMFPGDGPTFFLRPLTYEP